MKPIHDLETLGRTYVADDAARLDALRFLLAELRSTPPALMKNCTDADFELVSARVNAILDEIELIATPRKLPKRLGQS